MVHHLLIKTPLSREIRVSRRGIRCLTQDRTVSKTINCLVATGVTFRGRYGHTFRWISALERVFLRINHSSGYSSRISVHVAPNYVLAFRVLQQFVRIQHLHEHFVERLLQSRLPAERSEPSQQGIILTMRLTEQYRRIEHVAKQQQVERSYPRATVHERQGDRAEADQKQALGVMEMVLKREAPIMSTVQQHSVRAGAVDRDETSVEKEQRLAQLPRSFSLADFSPHEVQHLTDQVVNTLDRRIIAMRERMGRV